MESSRGTSETLLVESYAKASKVCTAQLKAVWLQLGLTVSEQQKELDKTACQAEEVWERAVQLAQEQQTGVQDQIAQALRDIDSIREELGIDMPPKQVRPAATIRAGQPPWGEGELHAADPCQHTCCTGASRQDLAGCPPGRYT